MVRLSEQELAAVVAAARADGLAAGAWLGELAVREAVAGGGWAWGLSRADVVGVLVRVRLDVSLAARLVEVGVDGAAQAGQVSRAVLARLDALIDRAVGDDVSKGTEAIASEEAGSAEGQAGEGGVGDGDAPRAEAAS